MIKKLMCLAVVGLCSTVVLEAQADQALPARKTVFTQDGSASHWFVEVGNYASFLQAGQNNMLPFAKRLSYVNPTFSVGRWHRPYFGTRLHLQGGLLKEAFLRKDKMTMAKHKYASTSLDFMFDVLNYFAPYKEERLFHVIPFVGVGTSYRWGGEICSSCHKGYGDENDRFSPLATVGMQLKFRLAKSVDFNLEGRVSANDFHLKSYADGAQWRGGYLGSIGASLTFHLGKKEFTPFKAQDDALIADLNRQLAALQAENAELAKRPVDCPEAEPAKTIPGISVGNVVYFRLNSDKVDPNQMINIRNIAEYAKNNTETITLVGYADRKTGTAKYNYELSERRAKNVKKVLVEKYGISAERIKTSWEGDRVQPYAENVWNRVVIMNAE